MYFIKSSLICRKYINFSTIMITNEYLLTYKFTIGQIFPGYSGSIPV